MNAYLAYSISDRDAHMVYELGDVLQNAGMQVHYHHDHPDHPKGQHAYDAVLGCKMFVGLITAKKDFKLVVQLWEYAQRYGLPAVLLIEDNQNVPSSVSRNPNVMVFKRFAPQNPIRFVEMWVSRR